MVGGIAAGAAVLLLVFFAFGTGTKENEKGSDTKRDGESSKVSSPETPAKKPTSVSLDDGKARGKSEPDRPAPAIDSDKLARAESLYREAKELRNESQKARTGGDPNRASELMHEAWDKVQEQRDLLDTYTQWYNEADFNDWKMPAEYDALGKRLASWDKLYQQIHKTKGGR